MMKEYMEEAVVRTNGAGVKMEKEEKSSGVYIPELLGTVV